MNDERPSTGAEMITHDTYMVGGAPRAGVEREDDHVPPLPVAFLGGACMGAQVDQKRADAPVIDVGVRGCDGRVGERTRKDVGVDKLLEVDAHRAQRADDDVGTHASGRDEIPPRIHTLPCIDLIIAAKRQSEVGRVIGDLPLDLQPSAGDDPGRSRRRVGSDGAFVRALGRRVGKDSLGGKERQQRHRDPDVPCPHVDGTNGAFVRSIRGTVGVVSWASWARGVALGRIRDIVGRMTKKSKPPFVPRTTIEVDVSWLDASGSKTEAPPAAPAGSRKVPPPVPGARSRPPPMPVVPRHSSRPPRRETIEVKAEWLDPHATVPPPPSESGRRKKRSMPPEG